MKGLVTKNGHDLFEMSSLLQKAIRRNHQYYAGYAANELYIRYTNYFWKRMLTISAEDCWGIITKEIIALKDADNFVNKNETIGRNPLFAAKAVVLLLKARKNRDADYFACNLMDSNITVSDEKYKAFFEEAGKKFDRTPEYAFDCHTRKGKANGKTKADMIKSEQAALNPHQEGDFDKEPWDRFFENQKIGFDLDKGFQKPTKQQLKELEQGQMKLL